MKTHKFYKDNHGWFIDLPGFPGPKSALAMVSGADTLLDKLSKNGKEITLTFSEESFPEANLSMKRKSLNLLGAGGADYITDTDNKDLHEHELWLCPVTLYVFGKYPKTIWVEYNTL